MFSLAPALGPWVDLIFWQRVIQNSLEIIFDNMIISQGKKVPSLHLLYSGKITRLYPMLLFVDTETTGLPGKKYPPFSPHTHWPRLVEIAWIDCKTDGSTIAEYASIIKPDSFTIPRSATAIHGITTEHARDVGADIVPIIEKFQVSIDNCLYVVGHNVDFDLTVIAAEAIRAGFPIPFRIPRKICTMRSSAKFCNLKRGAGYKYPTLSELHQKLFGSPFPNSHRALNDARACMKCFFELTRRGID